ncbi:hypothetical protein [Mesorhizobium sp. WSM3882]|uniref:hypothetical protein n=1 Tax=Mesorhizobium sp. WSM3882 TaxID=2029407 RepID=UPI000BAFB4F7|nr:hypothetical protein [Mesorhizobium sp. WSM3882]PBB31109.1 hypothetical protein CK214_19000 [Mesorhizobium sp. WSM3882]
MTFSRGKFQVSENATPANKLLIEELDAMRVRLERIEMIADIEIAPTTIIRRPPGSTIRISSIGPDPAHDIQSVVRPLLRENQAATYQVVDRNQMAIRVPLGGGGTYLFEKLSSALGPDYSVTHERED